MELEINAFYDLFLYGSTINGTAYRNVQLVSILNYETAIKFDHVDATHKQVYKYLPEGTPSDQRQYKYYLFKIGDSMRVFADYWLIPGKTTKRVGMTCTLNLIDVRSDQIADVRDQLRLMGIKFTIEE